MFVRHIETLFSWVPPANLPLAGEHRVSMSGDMFQGIGVSVGRHSIKNLHLILRMEGVRYDLQTHRGETGEEIASRNLLQLQCVKPIVTPHLEHAQRTGLGMSRRPSYTHRFGERPLVGDLIPVGHSLPNAVHLHGPERHGVHTTQAM